MQPLTSAVTELAEVRSLKFIEVRLLSLPKYPLMYEYIFDLINYLRIMVLPEVEAR